MNFLFQTLLLPVLLRGWEGLEYVVVSWIHKEDEELLETGLRWVMVVIDTMLEAFKLLENVQM